jgi:hypothetical protein
MRGSSQRYFPARIRVPYVPTHTMRLPLLPIRRHFETRAAPHSALSLHSLHDSDSHHPAMGPTAKRTTVKLGHATDTAPRQLPSHAIIAAAITAQGSHLKENDG